MRIICSLHRFKPWGEAVKVFEKIQLQNKLPQLEAYLEEMYGDELEGSTLNDILAYDNEELLRACGLLEEEIEESLDLKKLNSVLEEALQEDEENIDILTFKFDFEVNGTDILCKNKYGYEVEVQLDDDEIDNQEDIFNEIETQLDDNAANIAEDGREITGTEIIDFKYDEEAKKGSFEFNIFCEGNEDFDESLNEGKLWYIGWRSNPQLKNGGYWKKFGQLTKAEAKKWEKPGYGDMSLTGYETEEEYNKALEEKGLK